MEATSDTVPTIPVSTERSGLWPYLDGSRCAFEYSSIDWEILKDLPGTYIFAKRAGDGPYCPHWQVLYAGEAEDLGWHLRDHATWPQAEALGATHIIVRPNDDRLDREECVRVWIREFSPPLNPTA